MHRIKAQIVAVLLVVFAVFSVHDYFFVEADADTQYELCYAAYDGGIALDKPSELHEHLHLLMAFHLDNPSRIAQPVKASRNYELPSLGSDQIPSVLQHPPLS